MDLLKDLMFPTNAAAVTPSDSTDLPRPGQLYIGGTGNVNVITVGGDALIFHGLPAGSVLPVLVSRVLSTSTTATNMRVLYSKYV